MTSTTRDEITQKLRGIVEPYVRNKEALGSIGEETNLLEDLQIDSMHLVDIILDTEEEFGIEIDDDAAERLVTVGAAIGVIEEQLRKKEAESADGE